MGERDDHSRVAIWTECQRMDMLLTESGIFPIPAGYRIDHREPGRTSTETYRQYELFCSSFTAGPGLGIRCNKECLQSRNHDLLGSPWFVAAEGHGEIVDADLSSYLDPSTQCPLVHEIALVDRPLL
jgi:hypothetical protein